MRRFLAGFVCALTVLPACTEEGKDTDSSSAGSTSAATNDASSSSASATTNNATTGASDPTTGASGTGSTSSASATTASGSSGGSGESVMEEFGHPCNTDAECQAVLGADGVCLKDILMVYNLPGGYCSKLCMLPDANTAYVPNDPTCGPGVYCIGADGYFEGCVIECTDNSQCPRAGYECRIMPQIGKDGDPKFCLMTEDNKI